MRRADVIHEARLWVGTPFHHAAHAKGVGCDCIGVVYGVAKTLGLTDAALPIYAKEPDGVMLESGLANEMIRVRKTDIQPADVLVFRFAKYPQHVGIYTGSTIIHAYQKVGGCVEHRLDPCWRRRHVSTYRFEAFA